MASLASKVVACLFLAAIALAEEINTKKEKTPAKKEVIEDLKTAHSYGLGYSQQDYGSDGQVVPYYGSNGVDFGQEDYGSNVVSYGQRPGMSNGVVYGQHPVQSGSHEGYEKAFVIPVYSYGHTGPAYGQQVKGSLPYGYTGVTLGGGNSRYGSGYYSSPYGRSYYNGNRGM